MLPAKVLVVDIKEEEKFAQVIVPDDQLSLAIGKSGQNAKLAAKLTGWKIDIKSESQFRKLIQEANNEETADFEIKGNEEVEKIENEDVAIDENEISEEPVE